MKTAIQTILKPGKKGVITALFAVTAALPVFSQKSEVKTQAGTLKVEELAGNLEHPWGMAFLPDKRLLVTERSGNLRILGTDQKLSNPLKGTPKVFNKGQGGLLDVALDPNFEQNKYVYLSFSEPGDNNTASTALGRGKLEGNELKDFQVIFRQEPKVEGPNHFGGRIVFTPDGYLMFTLAERFKFEPAQDLSNHLGTVVRINPDGTVPKDNPFVSQANTKPEIWSYGHRNIESAAIDPNTNKLWIAEMGPKGGDELNQPEPGRNYGWPLVSWGNNYDDTKIPNPPTRPEFADAVIKWTPTISPSGMVFYTGAMLPSWKGSMLIGGLTSTGIVRVAVKGEQAEEVERIALDTRVRDVEQAPDGSVYVLTDKSNGKILCLSPVK
ncbi:PQQ-dependent sugar dehydrogenase [Pontibacter rugosus]|uniref:PQQ-dependent sugar dehydrogenase n=1 Tax=Pontibacter rugosus TaxID=1745966 RepID=A0ABW3SN60_9BACT